MKRQSAKHSFKNEPEPKWRETEEKQELERGTAEENSHTRNQE